MSIEFNRRALKVLQSFPDGVKERTHAALEVALAGGLAVYAKPMRGFHGASVVEIRMPHTGDTYRVVYSHEANQVVFVVHAFMKKSKHGISTPKHDIDLIHSRLRDYRG